LPRPERVLLVVITTFPEREGAERVAAGLVDSGLAVCAQVGADLISFYRWQGARERASEVSVTLKVRNDRLEACLERLRQLHPYQTPELIAWPASRVDEAYLGWAWQDDP
jgi:periplasmic divalent cation tolerance protein